MLPKLCCKEPFTLTITRHCKSMAQARKQCPVLGACWQLSAHSAMC